MLKILVDFISNHSTELLLIVMILCVVMTRIIVERFSNCSIRHHIKFKISKPYDVYADTTTPTESMPAPKTSNEEIIKFIQISREEEKSNKK